MMMKENHKSFIRGAVAGSIAGSLAALLFAPKSGRDLRQDITDQARLVSDKGQELAGKITDASIEYTDKIKDTASAVIHEIGQFRKKGGVLPEVSISSDPVQEDIKKDSL
nr:YtxH domain-containing protein [Paenibacillus terrae]